jgi:hypothetical protein
VDGGAGEDTVELYAGLSAHTLVASGGAAAASLAFDAYTMTLSRVEVVRVQLFGGADRVDFSGVTDGGLRLLAETGGGADTVIGGEAADVLTGGGGDDSLTGGGGGDRFVAGAQNGDGRRDLDVITDFSRATGDVLDLRDAAGSFTASVEAEGVLVTLAGGDGDQVLLRGLTSLADLAVWPERRRAPQPARGGTSATSLAGAPTRTARIAACRKRRPRPATRRGSAAISRCHSAQRPDPVPPGSRGGRRPARGIRSCAWPQPPAAGNRRAASRSRACIRSFQPRGMVRL